MNQAGEASAPYVAAISYPLASGSLTGIYRSETEEELYESLAGYVRFWWDVDLKDPMPEGLTDKELVEEYFKRHPRETLEITRNTTSD